MADPAVGVVCNGGACGEISPVAALVLLAIDALVTELKKEKPFGPNNDIVKALETAQKDILNGAGPNNDVVKALEGAWRDLSTGLGENNDLRKALEKVGLRF